MKSLSLICRLMTLSLTAAFFTPAVSAATYYKKTPRPAGMIPANPDGSGRKTVTSPSTGNSTACPSPSDSGTCGNSDSGSCGNSDSGQTADSAADGSAVAQALSRLTYVNHRPDAKADYYIYLLAASWCQYSSKAMPDIVKAYSTMQSENVELVLLCSDTSAAAKSFISKYSAKFPTTTNSGSGLPGMARVPGIPYMIIVDKDGKTLSSNSTTYTLFTWRSIIQQDRAQKQNASAEAEQQEAYDNDSSCTGDSCTQDDSDDSSCTGDSCTQDDSDDSSCTGDSCTQDDSDDSSCSGDSCTQDDSDDSSCSGDSCTQETESSPAPAQGSASRVAQALSKLSYINTQPNMRADYYVYLQAASWCGYCRQAMPNIVSEYGAMKSENVEIVFFSADSTPAAALNYIKQYGATFPTTMGSGASMPGMVQSGGVPNVSIVDKNGATIAYGHPTSVLYQWRTLIAKDKLKKQSW